MGRADRVGAAGYSINVTATAVMSKADKGVVRRFVAKVTGWSRAHTTRLIGQYRKTGRIKDRRRGATRPFERRYTAADSRARDSAR